VGHPRYGGRPFPSSESQNMIGNERGVSAVSGSHGRLLAVFARCVGVPWPLIPICVARYLSQARQRMAMLAHLLLLRFGLIRHVRRQTPPPPA
jgi:hypothetical protein